ncbi:MULTISPECIES: hypothetical protein [Actinokineospora]|uniref:Uncharacterized protein n=1 Tax=Actinokineospora fastidiosa TaxID=1816 RepID=A0A918L900_9PSEU|nr:MULTISPECIES: hypothetical protein [Actinokineospora]UVS82283.1 hypothetical protein Actkin_06052 [Actinokineospora sp. UTMC 2448]GGS22329.1 hypothetical protein GCM10010171_13950 [Actinokineospora fastidiosa]
MGLTPDPRLTDADFDLIASRARSAEASPALRALQCRIDRGDLTWRDITDGRTARDPDVRRAVESGFPRWDG